MGLEGGPSPSLFNAERVTETDDGEQREGSISIMYSQTLPTQEDVKAVVPE